MEPARALAVKPAARPLPGRASSATPRARSGALRPHPAPARARTPRSAPSREGLRVRAWRRPSPPPGAAILKPRWPQVLTLVTWLR